ncbi:Platinum sensitivity protein [Linnemannia zychae]|nr:Platinum sensitivity protein [Linnemannia zychae]
MKVHNGTAKDDPFFDTIKQKGEALTGDHEFMKLQGLDTYSDVWNAFNDYPRDYYASVPTNGQLKSPLLPNPSHINLKEIESILTSMGSVEEDQLMDFIVGEGYIDKMVAILETCEALNIVTNMHILRAILLHLIQLSELGIIEEVIKDVTFYGCLGILEYESENMDEKSCYRQIYTSRANFKQIIPFNDVEVEKLIHQVFRLQFLKDMVLFGTLEEESRQIMESFISRKTTRIVQIILSDYQFLNDIFDILKDTSKPLELRQNIVFFIHQFCTMAKKPNNTMYRRLCSLGLLVLVEFALESNVVRIKQAGIEILLMTLEDNANLVRSYIVEQDRDVSEKNLFDIVINLIVVDKDTDFVPQLAEVVQVLVDIDPESADESNIGFLIGGSICVESSSELDPDADQFLDLFYIDCCIALIKPVLELSNSLTTLDRNSSTRCAFICKLMSFLIQQHPTRCKYLLTSTCFVEKIGILLNNRDKHLRLVALKFFRTCLGLEKDCINEILIENKVIHKVVNLLQNTNCKDDLLNSSCLEFFNFIRERKIKMLASHCSTVHRKTLGNITYTTIFKDLMAIHGDDSDDFDNNSNDGVLESTSRGLWDSQSRLFPGTEVPLISREKNGDSDDSGYTSFLSAPIQFKHAGLQTDEGDVDGSINLNTLPLAEKQKDPEPDESMGVEPMLPLPFLSPCANNAELGSFRTDGSADINTNSATCTEIATMPLISESTHMIGDTVTEVESNFKRRREDEDSEHNEASARSKPRLDEDALQTFFNRARLYYG